jgi:hypothetical protein
MGLLSKGGYNDSYERTIAQSVKLCKITAYRDNPPKDKGDGKPARGVEFYTLALQEAAKTIDGDSLEPGFPKDIGLGYYEDTHGDAGAETANRMSRERTRELVVAALGLPVSHKDVEGELKRQGGADALIGKLVNVAFSAKDGRQNVDRFMAPLAKTV